MKSMALNYADKKYVGQTKISYPLVFKNGSFKIWKKWKIYDPKCTTVKYNRFS